MGQRIEVDPTVLDGVMLLDTNRSITGQEGTVYASAADAESDSTFGGRLAVRLFEADREVENVFIASNQVVIRRARAWDAGSAEAISKIVEDLFVFYR
jgi:hypothetical protein